MQESNRINRDQTPEPTSNLGATLLRVAWLAIALGLLMEVILLVLGGALGEVFGLRPLVADLVRNISWSVFVCVGLAIGTAVVKARVPVMGFLGLLSAPLAFEASRVFHKGTLEALAVSGGGRRPLPGVGSRYQGDRVRVPGVGRRLGEPTSVGRRGGTRGCGSPGRPPIRRNRDSPCAGDDSAAARRQPLARGRQRDPFPRRLLPGSLLCQGSGREDNEPGTGVI